MFFTISHVPKLDINDTRNVSLFVYNSHTINYPWFGYVIPVGIEPTITINHPIH